MTTKLLTALLATTFASAGAVWAEAETATGATAPAAAEEKEENAVGVQGLVARSTFTTEVVDREPVDAIEQLTSDADLVYYFTELKGMAGQTLTHRWEWNGQVMAEVPFEVGGPRWRTYSTKKLEPSWLGEWTVSVVDSDGHVMQSDTLTYAAPAEVAATDAPDAMAQGADAAEAMEPAEVAPPAAVVE